MLSLTARGTPARGSRSPAATHRSTASARAMNDPSRSVAGESSVTASIPRDDARNHEVPVREFGRVRLDDRDGKARIHGVRAEGHRAGHLLALKELVRDFPERFEMVDDSR